MKHVLFLLLALCFFSCTENDLTPENSIVTEASDTFLGFYVRATYATALPEYAEILLPPAKYEEFTSQSVTRGAISMGVDMYKLGAAMRNATVVQRSIVMLAVANSDPQESFNALYSGTVRGYNATDFWKAVARGDLDDRIPRILNELSNAPDTRVGEYLLDNNLRYGNVVGTVIPAIMEAATSVIIDAAPGELMSKSKDCGEFFVNNAELFNGITPENLAAASATNLKQLTNFLKGVSDQGTLKELFDVMVDLTQEECVEINKYIESMGSYKPHFSDEGLPVPVVTTPTWANKLFYAGEFEGEDTWYNLVLDAVKDCDDKYYFFVEMYSCGYINYQPLYEGYVTKSGPNWLFTVNSSNINWELKSYKPGEYTAVYYMDYSDGVLCFVRKSGADLGFDDDVWIAYDSW